MLSDPDRLRMLTPRTGLLRAVLDTDTYNEIDDQFALVQAMLSPDRISLEAIYAAPFHNRRSTGPGDGMDKSYEEICGFSIAWADRPTALRSEACETM